MAPIDEAIHSWNAQLSIPPKERQSMRDIADKYGIHQATLSKRLFGRCQPRSEGHAHLSEGHAHLRALKPAQEQGLVEWIARCVATGNPPGNKEVKDIALNLLENHINLNPSPGPPQPARLGANWVPCLCDRCPELAGVWTRTLDTQRLKAEEPAKLAPWFAEIGSLMDRHQYHPSQMFNMDKSGFAIGAPAQSMHVITVINQQRCPQKAKKASLGRQEWVTSVKCISAAGTALPPFSTFKGTGKMNDGWSHGWSHGCGCCRLAMGCTQQGMDRRHARLRLACQCL